MKGVRRLAFWNGMFIQQPRRKRANLLNVPVQDLKSTQEFSSLHGLFKITGICLLTKPDANSSFVGAFSSHHLRVYACFTALTGLLVGRATNQLTNVVSR